MADSSFTAGEVLDCLFEDEFGLSDDGTSDEDDEDYIYGYLGGKILRRPDPRFDFPAEDEESLLEGPSEDMDDDLGFTRASGIPADGMLDEESEHTSHEEPSSEVVSASFDTVSAHSYIIMQVLESICCQVSADYIIRSQTNYNYKIKQNN